MRDESAALVWPPRLELPSDEVRVVYLDLNHWISLAKASTRHLSGFPFVETLEACRAARSAGTAVFVLSAIHYMEMQKIRDPAQRRDITNVMAELTGFTSLVDRIVVMKLELDAMIDVCTREPSLLPSVPLLGLGIRHSFGRKSGVRITGPFGDATEKARARMGVEAFEYFVPSAELLLTRSVLQGPDDDDEALGLRKHGWNPESAIHACGKRAAQERELTAILSRNMAWRRGRLRDVVSARELGIEFEDILPLALAQRHLALSDICSNQESARKLVRAMPSTEVSIELKTAWHCNPDKPWAPNDIYDIDAMSLAVPYCDIVVTEKGCHHVLNAARLGERMHTALLRRLEDLPRTLEKWIPRRGVRKADE